MANKLYEYVIRMVDRASATMDKVAGGASKLDNKLHGVIKTAQRAAVAVGLAFGASQIAAYGGEALQTAAKVQGMQNAIVFASGSAKEGAANLGYLTEVSDRLGLNQMAATEGFRTFNGALMDMGFTGQQTRTMFEGVATASTAMGLSADDAKGVYLALGQIMSKGKVSAEELRGQIGERLPGAFQMAAKAMGMTTQQLDKMMQDGKLLSKNFIIPFTNELQKSFEGALPVAVNSLQANLNRLDNGFGKLQTTLINEFTPEIMAGIQVLRADFIPAVKEGFGYLRSAVTWIRENKTELKALAVGLGAASIAYGLLNLRAKWNATYMGLSTISLYANAIATNGLSRAWSVLNSIMYANPIGVVVGLVAALAAGLYYAWQKCETFRAAVFALWEVIKNFFSSVYHFMHGFHTLNWDEMKNAFYQIGLGSVDAWKKGWASGISDFHIEERMKVSEARRKARADSGNSIWDLIHSPDPTKVGSAGKPDAKTNKGIDSISEGGKRQTIINISINKLVEKIDISTTTLNESASEIEAQVAEVLIRLLNGAQQSFGQ